MTDFHSDDEDAVRHADLVRKGGAIKLILRWARAYARAVSHDGMWVYAPPLVITASSAIWRAAPPPRIEEPPAPPPAPVTDPQLVAARRASLRLIVGSQGLT